MLEKSLYLRDQETPVVQRLKIASSFMERGWGLLGHKGLADDEAMLIEETGSIHTFFMRFALDLLFLDNSGKVLKTIENLPPWRMAWVWFGGKQVVELGAGALSRLPGRGIVVGDFVEIR